MIYIIGVIDKELHIIPDLITEKNFPFGRI